MTLPDGAGSITFEKDIKEWAGFQIVQQSGNGWALAGAVFAIAGLAASLFVQRRRVWVRAVEGADGVTVVEMAGLGRTESARVPEELGDLAALVHDKAPARTDTDTHPDPDPASDAGPAPDREPDADTPVSAEGAEKK
jgi:cytochrome c biogenesis protein